MKSRGLKKPTEDGEVRLRPVTEEKRERKWIGIRGGEEFRTLAE